MAEGNDSMDFATDRLYFVDHIDGVGDSWVRLNELREKVEREVAPSKDIADILKNEAADLYKLLAEQNKWSDGKIRSALEDLMNRIFEEGMEFQKAKDRDAWSESLKRHNFL